MVAGNSPLIRFGALKLSAVIAAAMFASLMVLAPLAQAATSTKNNFTLTKTVSPNPGTVGQQMTFTITETNNQGAGVGFGGQAINDILPSGVAYVSATIDLPQGTCSFDPNTNTASCGNSFLPDGQTATVKVVVIPTKSGDFTNTANDAGLGNVVQEPFKVNAAPSGGGGGGGGHHKEHHHGHGHHHGRGHH